MCRHVLGAEGDAPGPVRRLGNERERPIDVAERAARRPGDEHDPPVRAGIERQPILVRVVAGATRVRDAGIPVERRDTGCHVRRRRLRGANRKCRCQQRDDDDDPEHAPTRHELPSTPLGSAMLAHGQGACPAVSRRWCRRSPGEGGRRGRSGVRTPRSCARLRGATTTYSARLRGDHRHRATRP